MRFAIQADRHREGTQPQCSTVDFSLRPKWPLAYGFTVTATAEPPDSLRWRSIETINREFYRQRPHSYLLRRLVGLVVTVGRPDLVDSAFEDGITLGQHDVRWSGVKLDEDEEQSYLTSEIEVLTYHSAESLLRLVLAHGRPDLPSPAFNLAGLNPQAELYKRAKHNVVDADDESLDALIVASIHGCEAIPEGAFTSGADAPTDDGLAGGRANLRDLLRYAANYIGNRDYQDVYNAAKHGLAVRTGNAGFRLGGGPDGQPIIDQSGEALHCLSAPRDRSKEVEQVTVWSNPGLSFGFIQLALQVMDQVWSLGKFRYAAADFESENFYFRTFEAPLWTDIQRLTYEMGPSRGDGMQFITMPTMRWPLGWVLDRAPGGGVDTGPVG